jgi:hypothetical protein
MRLMEGTLDRSLGLFGGGGGGKLRARRAGSGPAVEPSVGGSGRLRSRAAAGRAGAVAQPAGPCRSWHCPRLLPARSRSRRTSPHCRAGGPEGTWLGSARGCSRPDPEGWQPACDPPGTGLGLGPRGRTWGGFGWPLATPVPRPSRPGSGWRPPCPAGWHSRCLGHTCCGGPPPRLGLWSARYGAVLGE